VNAIISGQCVDKNWKILPVPELELGAGNFNFLRVFDSSDMICDNMRHGFYQQVTEKFVFIYNTSEYVGKYMGPYWYRSEVKSEIVDWNLKIEIQNFHCEILI